MGPSDEQVLAWFQPMPVHGRDAVTLEKIRDDFASLAQNVLMLIPPSADRTAALRDLLKASQSAVFAFTHNQEN